MRGGINSLAVGSVFYFSRFCVFQDIGEKSLAELMLNFVVPDLQCPEAFVRARVSLSKDLLWSIFFVDGVIRYSARDEK